jgi:Primase C terminal 1 (PriCT-1)/Bifunctional DNA primase/polymerase, N-terminal
VSRAREWGIPEATPTVKTPRRGGRHFYLRGRGPTRTDFAAGVDLRGAGGYAVGAGARRMDGEYRWVVPPWEVDEAAIPAELERLIGALREGGTAKRAPGQVVTKGDRNRYLAAKGGSMRRAGMSAEAIGAALHAENVATCRPPLEGREVDRIVKSCSKMEGAPPWVIDPWSLMRDERLSTNARLVLDALCRAAKDDGTVRGGEWLADWTQLHRNSVSSAIKDIRRAGLLEVVEQPRQVGRANLYRLLARSTELGNGRPSQRGGS